MKKRTINIFSILLVFLLLLVGCRDSGQEQPLGEWDREAGILTVDGVRYRKDEALVSIGDGLHRWRYEQSVTEQIASTGERGGQETYLVFADGTERRLLYGRGDGFSFGPLSYEVWFREDLLDELSGPLTEEKVSCGTLTDAQLTQLLALYESTEQKDSLSYEDAQAEARAMELESHRLWRWLELPHREIPGVSAHISFYFSARTGAPYLRCLDGALRPCPTELTDALALLPSLPQILSVTEDDPRLKPLLDTLYPMSRTEGLSWDEFLHTFSADQSPEALEFRIDLYRPEEDSWPVQVLRGCCHPQTGTPYLLFQDGQLRPVPQNAADSLGLSK